MSTCYFADLEREKSFLLFDDFLMCFLFKLILFLKRFFISIVNYHECNSIT